MMKTFIYLFIVSVVSLSCEEVIDVTLSTEDPRLVIDASINWFNGTPGNDQVIKLSLTAPYFENNILAAHGAQVVVTDTNNAPYEFIEQGNTGLYYNTNFIPVANEIYSLKIVYQNETYTATEVMKTVARIDSVEQNNDGGFSGEEVEIKAFFMDPEAEENYYFFEFISDIPEIPSLEVYKDEFINGNQTFGFYTEEELTTGDTVVIRNYGVSQQFYNYMFVLLQQSSQEGGGPFEPQPTTVRGNCINETNPGHYPFGYFRISQVDELLYLVE